MTAPLRPVVLFDLDGTLVDTIPLIVASYLHVGSSVLGETWDEVDVRSWIGRTLVDTFTERYPDRVEELLEAYQRYNLAEMERLIGTYPGVGEMLAALHGAGVRTGVVTSKGRRSADLSLRFADLGGAIEVLVAKDDTDRHKPDPTPLLLGLERLGAGPHEAVYVGDATVDVLAARAAGMSSVAVTWGAGTAEALAACRPDHTVASAAALQELLLNRM